MVMFWLCLMLAPLALVVISMIVSLIRDEWS